MARERKPHARREDVDRAGPGIVDEDGLAVPQTSRERLPIGAVRHFTTVGDDAELVPVHAPGPTEDTHHMDLRHGRQR
ncbi:hypothetical protein AFR_28925 [Actinoplanes friuliensis DSM 7358]|uniref:Uncharacterized protein n=1 Tax=Actinoplanes friuliensis DSM 7358 TaxID=1246995 RepID=U5W802_9ACTN|nr:hypothetical protein AFR_28925 [Actinoplanes friuliensis DSM 7358]